jgi:enolase-phosphatase E1
MPFKFAGRIILLDIEGTTSSIRYVHEVLFPYARRELAQFLKTRWDDPKVQATCEQIARDAGAASLSAWLGGNTSNEGAQTKIAAEVQRLMDIDAKATGMKELQGLIWENGFTSGILRAHVYPDVPPALEAWTKAGKEVRIYSSGSIAAQRLFFAHTEAGDLLKFLRGHYDTTIGGKKSAASYRAITTDLKCAADEILFVSDVVAELDAAREIGMVTALSIRPGNIVASPVHGHAEIKSFLEIAI